MGVSRETRNAPVLASYRLRYPYRPSELFSFFCLGNPLPVRTSGVWALYNSGSRLRLGFGKEAIRCASFESELATATGSFLKEGLGNWVFGLLYNTLITIGILSVVPLTRGNADFIHHDDVFGNLYRFTLAIHFILAFGGSVIYAKIVTWKHDLIVFWICFDHHRLILLIGLLSSFSLHLMHRPLYAWIFPSEVYQPAAPFVSWMVLGRFLALASGFFVGHVFFS